MRQRNGRFTTVLVITRVMYIIARAASANPGEVLIRWEFVSRCDVGIVMTSLRVIGNSYSVPWTYKRRPVRSSRAGPQGAGECACGSPASEAHDTLATADRRPGPWADRLATARPAIRLTGRTLYHTVVQWTGNDQRIMMYSSYWSQINHTWVWRVDWGKWHRSQNHPGGPVGHGDRPNRPLSTERLIKVVHLFGDCQCEGIKI